MNLFFISTLIIGQVFQDHATLRGHADTVLSVSFSADSKMLATGSYDRTIKLWNVSDASEIATLEGHDDRVHSAQFMPKSMALLSIDSGGRLLNWDLSDGKYKVKKSNELEKAGDADTIEIHPDGQTIAVTFVKFTGEFHLNGFGHGGVDFYDASRMEKICDYNNFYLINCVGFSPKGSIAAIGTGEGRILFFDYQKKQLVNQHLNLSREGEPIPATSIAFDPGKNVVAYGDGRDYSIKIWDFSANILLATLEGHIDPVSSIAFSHDGNLIVSGSDDKSIKIWSNGPYKEMKTLKSHNSAIASVAISPDDNYIASGSYDRTAMIWKIERPKGTKGPR